ncbi:copper resistance protein B [Roseomonas sp. E05]|uniref:copper resistance protein B n=1 Tax=Roseomonas sp. E05 TaxID=3046310 RepID=UPI0024B91827|nr:copper resistance protein B [Roseomonas sp. E05]MDJ0390318.1 copper resistance protein B [Roseomonas sp. E05]
MPRNFLPVLPALGLLAAMPAQAQVFGDSGAFFGSGLGADTLQGASPYGNLIADDRVYMHGILNQNEGRFGDGSYYRWSSQAWIGNDYNRLRLRTEGRYNSNNKGKVDDGQHELLYERPISTYFDLQAGVRADIDDGTGRTWAALGVQGLAIGFWNVAVTTYASDRGHFALRTDAAYDLYVTQRLVLQPQFETNWYTKDDEGRGVGAGLADIDMGLRLRYDISRKFSPYIGVAYQRFFGGTARMRREEGGQADDLRFLVGLRAWF